MNTIRIGVLGLGTVGCGLLNLLQRNGDLIQRRSGAVIQVTKAAVRDLSKQRSAEIEAACLTTEPMDVVRSEEVDIVVELMGGESTAKTCIEEAIRLGKPVVTANKALLAQHGNALCELAEAAQVPIAYEAAVAGGIPIIKVLREGLAGNQIECVAGIINGTSNYILSQMASAGCAYQEALKQAQALGYAEADPTFDVAGIDAAHKLTVMASLAFGGPLSFEQVIVEGLEDLSVQDINYAQELGYVVKPLALCRQAESGIEMRVYPTLIPQGSLLANVHGVQNAVMVCSDALGKTFYIGPGAGAEATASAVLADLLDVVRVGDRLPPILAFKSQDLRTQPVVKLDELYSSMYLRMQALDEPGILAEITAILSHLDISIDSIVQKRGQGDPGYQPVVILTHPVLESVIYTAIERLNALESIQGQVVRLRMEKLDWEDRQ